MNGEGLVNALRERPAYRDRWALAAEDAAWLVKQVDAMLTEARKEECRHAATLARNPYSDEVQALAGMEPREVGERIASAIWAQWITRSIKAAATTPVPPPPATP